MASDETETKQNKIKYARKIMRDLHFPILSGFKKNNKKRQKTKIHLKLERKRCRRNKAIFCPSKYVQLSHLRTPFLCPAISHQ